MERKTYIIDATNKTIGRLASKIALILRGKHKPDFFPYKDIGDIVLVKNIKKVIFKGKKLNQKKYFRHSGYLGGDKFIPVKKVFESKPQEVLKKAVLGMLPKNRLRAKQIKRLKFED